MIRHALAIKRLMVTGAAASGLVLAMAAVPAAGAAQQVARVRAAPGTARAWGTAIEVPGLATLGVRGAEVVSVSCASPGNCSAGGFYTDGSGGVQGFVVSQSSGAWGTAIEVPGLATLNAKGFAEVVSVSCGAAGNCSAGGFYTDNSGKSQGFVVSQSNGVWGTAIEVPGLATLNTGVQAQVSSMSCASAGNCSAGGYYNSSQGFVVSQSSGVWGTAIEVPGLATLSPAGVAPVVSVSCASAGNCSAAGTYRDSSDHFQGFVVGQRSGHWDKAIGVPGLGALNVGGNAGINSVSCASAGNCSAAGTYLDHVQLPHGFVVSQSSGHWGKAIQVPGLGALDAGADVKVDSVSCGSAGNCAASGSYTDGSGFRQGFVVGQSTGVWGTAIEVPGLGALNAGGSAGVNSVSCASAGNCSAGGFYNDSPSSQGFVAGQSKGHWGTAIEVPGLGALNAGGSAGVNSVSCASAGNCSAGGSYVDGSGVLRGFVVSES